MTPQEFCTANNITSDQLVNAMLLYPGDEAAQLASLLSYQQGVLIAQQNAIAAQLAALSTGGSPS